MKSIFTSKYLFLILITAFISGCNAQTNKTTWDVNAVSNFTESCIHSAKQYNAKLTSLQIEQYCKCMLSKFKIKYSPIDLPDQDVLQVIADSCMIELYIADMKLQIKEKQKK